MRMWGVNPRGMCRQHLLGEHLEMHMFAGSLRKGKPVGGYVRKGLVELHAIGRRHDELSAEMERRGYSHRSPIGRLPSGRSGRVDTGASRRELARRCPECRRMQRMRGAA